MVVSVNGKILEVAKQSHIILKDNSWSEWHWMPGRLNNVQNKLVIFPLKEMRKVDFGPGIGTHTKSNFYAYDFSVTEGTEVYPMEAGVVTKVVDLYETAHQDEKRMNENNMVEILHLDGTISRYSHLKKNSLNVKECEVIEINRLIGLSGNTGFSSGPHLHVDMFKPISGAEYKTLPLVFSKRD